MDDENASGVSLEIWPKDKDYTGGMESLTDSCHPPGESEFAEVIGNRPQAAASESDAADPPSTPTPGQLAAQVLPGGSPPASPRGSVPRPGQSTTPVASCGTPPAITDTLAHDLEEIMEAESTDGEPGGTCDAKMGDNNQKEEEDEEEEEEEEGGEDTHEDTPFTSTHTLRRVFKRVGMY